MRKRLMTYMVLICLMMNICLPFSVVNSASLQGQSNLVSQELSNYEQTTVTDSVYSSVTESVYGNDLNTLLSKIQVFDDPMGTKPKEKYIIKLKKSASQRMSAQRMGGASPSEIFDAISLELTVEQVNHIVNYDLVETIEVDHPITISSEDKGVILDKDIRENSQTTPWGLHATGAYLTNSLDKTGDKVKVAVFDTGIATHSDLELAGGISFVEGSSEHEDENGHGTHIAGTIAAHDNQAGVVGFSNNIELYSVKVLGSTGTGYTSSVVQGIEWAINNEIKIINMSFVGTEYSAILAEAILEAHKKGIIIVGAAGNGGLGENTIQYPARYTDVLAVGAVDASYIRSEFSATGSELAFVAPGTNILSTTNNGGYGTYSGTSQAAAHVTGALALLWSKNSKLTSDDIVQQLKITATNLGPLEQYGAGMINVARALGVISNAIAPMGSSYDETPRSIWVPSVTNPEISIASYGRYGSGMTYEPGETATVGLKLEGDTNGKNIHSQIIIEVYASANPNVILSSKLIQNPQLDQDIQFNWGIPSNAATGQYFIKFRYPAIPNGSWDDYFDIYVAQAGLGPDTYEPNNTLETAYPVTPTNSYISYLSSSSDTDYYRFSSQKAGSIDISLVVPANKDYDLQVYDQNGHIIAYSPLGIGQAEVLSVTLEAGQRYYIRVFGYSGDFGAEPYALSLGEIDEINFPAPTDLVASPLGDQIKLNWEAMQDADSYELQLNGVAVGTTTANTFTFKGLAPFQTYIVSVAAVYPQGISSYTPLEVTTSIAELLLDRPIDVLSEKDQLYSFTPPTTGIYKIFTESYMNQGKQEDTILNIYADSLQTKLLFSNDDYNSTSFSEVKMNLVAGETYYVKLSWLGFGENRARITAKVLQSSIPFIQLNQPVNIDEKLSDHSSVYVFIPNRSGQFKIKTDFYDGVVTKNENDTVVELFYDVNLTNAVVGGMNDDRSNSTFSEVNVLLSANIPYYIRVKENSNLGVYARLTVSSAGEAGYIPLTIDNEVNITTLQNQEALYKFTPNDDGKYRFYTSRLSSTAALADTVLELYSDPDLQNMIAMNDDVDGKASYGSTYSKIEMSLNANQTYYILVRGYNIRMPLQAKFMVEGMAQGNKEGAQTVQWGDLITSDSQGNPLKISSLYDIDYYQIDLSEPEQVYVNVSEGMGVIENSIGNVFGYFSEGGDSVFNLPAGTYYLRVQDNLFSRGSSGVPPYEYELLVQINRIEYVSFTDTGTNPIARSLVNNQSQRIKLEEFDATPSSIERGKARFPYTNINNSVKLLVEVNPKLYGSQKRLAHSYVINTPKSKGSTTFIEWDGRVTENEDIALIFPSPYGNYYYAKNGDYEITVSEITSAGKKKSYQTAGVKVNNNPLEEINRVPLPPKKGMIKGKITEIDKDNKDSCQECRNYYWRYIMSPSADVPESAYQNWSAVIYGKNGMEKFWSVTESLIIYNNNLTLLENFQRTLDYAGMIPVVEYFADGTNGIIYFLKDDKPNAMLSFASLTPIVGDFATGKRILGFAEVKHALKSCMEAKCMKEAYDIKLPHKVVKKQDLKYELGLVVKKPDLTPGIRNWEAHHIIPQGGTAGVFITMQNKLKSLGIDINSAANGVWLPVKSGVTPPVDYFNIINTETLIEWKVASHKKHSTNYGDYLYARIKDLTTKEEILHEISQVRNLLLDGDIDLVNPTKL